MRNITFATGEHYHIFNRGNNKQRIFLDDKDRMRFVCLILYLQSISVIPHIGRLVASLSKSRYVKHSVFDIKVDIEKDTLKKRYVELVSFVLMPNHFHLIVRQLKNNGISQYMQRILNAYTKYFNTKYKKSGHLFQGPFQTVHIADNEQLLHLSAYIHRNPREIKEWKNKEHKYPWSSYLDYVGKNRWGSLLVPTIISEQFIDGKEYKNFVEKSGTKMLIGETLLFN